MNITTLQELIIPVVEGLGYQCWGIEYLPQGKHSLLRVYIDTEQGVTIDACQIVGEQLNAVLDIEQPISGQYTLEVSSPGINRLLFTQPQFVRYIGHKIAIRMRTMVNQRRNFKGVILAVDDNHVTIEMQGETVLLAINDIDKARLVEDI